MAIKVDCSCSQIQLEQQQITKLTVQFSTLEITLNYDATN